MRTALANKHNTKYIFSNKKSKRFFESRRRRREKVDFSYSTEDILHECVRVRATPALLHTVVSTAARAPSQHARFAAHRPRSPHPPFSLARSNGLDRLDLQRTAHRRPVSCLRASKGGQSGRDVPKREAVHVACACAMCMRMRMSCACACACACVHEERWKVHRVMLSSKNRPAQVSNPDWRPLDYNEIPT